MTDVAPETFAEWQLQLAPKWLRRGHGASWLAGFGAMKDDVEDLAGQAVKARIVRTAPMDALPLIGEERKLERFTFETAEDHRARLENAWDAYGEADSDLGMIHRLAEIGLSVRIRRNNQWDFDGHPGNVLYYWARFWVLCDSGPYSAAHKWESFAWDDGSTWDLTIDPDRCLWIGKLIRKWKGSHSYYWGTVMIVVGPVWDDLGLWDGFNWDDSIAVFLAGDAP